MYYDKKHCKIYYDKDVKAVVLKWNGFATSELFREACNESLKLLIEKRASKMIADNTDASSVHKDDQNWMLSDWFPKAYKNGWRTSAVVVSKNIFRELALKHIVQNLDDGDFVIDHFDDFENARKWVASADKK